MTSSAVDYRTLRGVSRRTSGESTLAKYMRALALGQTAHSDRDALPLARPRIVCTLSADQFTALLDILDIMFALEGAARFVDRKSSRIARRRLSRALALELGTQAEMVERLFSVVDNDNVALIAPAARLLLGCSVLEEQSAYEVRRDCGSIVIDFNRAKIRSE